MKQKRSPAVPENPAIEQDLPERLVELEVELRRHSERKSEDRPLQSIGAVAEVTIGLEKAIKFTLAKRIYAAGHRDIIYGQSNHARGVRHVLFYEGEKVVLDIEGDFEEQQMGSNFRFKNIDLYLPGAWEIDFIKLTDVLRDHATERRLAFNKKRAAEHARRR